VRNRRRPGASLAAAALLLGTATAPATATIRATTATTAVRADAPRAGDGTAAGAPSAVAGTGETSGSGAGTAAGPPGAPCGAFPGGYQLGGADGTVPAAWSGGGLVVPACGPPPGDGGSAAPVYAYPGALWTAGYQCVEFSERYLYDRYGVTMGIVTNGDQVAAHYAAGFPGLFILIRNGTPYRAASAGDVLSLSTAPGFDSASGGHSAVVQSSSVNAAGSGTVTVVEENAAGSGVAVLAVSGWTVRYPGFPYIEWLSAAVGRQPEPPRPSPLAAAEGSRQIRSRLSA
jgi:hypothetical protein